MIEQTIKNKLGDLVERARYATDDLRSAGRDTDSWEGWITEALHIVELLFPNPDSVYRSRVEEIALDELNHIEARVQHVGSIWPAPGSEDTELGVLMELEVDYGETEVYAGVQT